MLERPPLWYIIPYQFLRVAPTSPMTGQIPQLEWFDLTAELDGIAGEGELCSCFRLLGGSLNLFHS